MLATNNFASLSFLSAVPSTGGGTTSRVRTATRRKNCTAFMAAAVSAAVLYCSGCSPVGAESACGEGCCETASVGAFDHVGREVSSGGSDWVAT